MPPQSRFPPMSKRRSRCPVSVPAPKIPPQPKRRSSPAVPAKTRPQVPRLSVLFQNEAKPNCAGQSFSLASLDSSLYTREPLPLSGCLPLLPAAAYVPHGPGNLPLHGAGQNRFVGAIHESPVSPSCRLCPTYRRQKYAVILSTSEGSREEDSQCNHTGSFAALRMTG